jgi:hypothetical protein
MKRAKRRLLIPQWDFGFLPDTFNLIIETGIDGERITRECEQAKKARQLADAAQTALFQTER